MSNFFFAYCGSKSFFRIVIAFALLLIFNAVNCPAQTKPTPMKTPLIKAGSKGSNLTIKKTTAVKKAVTVKPVVKSKPAVNETVKGGTQKKTEVKKPIKGTSSFPKIKAGESYFYRVTWQGELAGYSKFSVPKYLTLAGETFYETQSVSELKIGIGQIDHLAFSSKMTFRGKDLKPTFFSCKQKQGAAEFSVDCLVSENLIAQKNVSMSAAKDSLVTLDSGQTPFIVMDNLWGRIDTLVEHYWLLIRSGKTGKIYAYDPVLLFKGFITLEKGVPSFVEIGKKKMPGILYKVKNFQGNPLFDIWADNQGRILKMQETGGGLTFEIADKGVIDELKKSVGADLWKDRVCRSNIFFPNAQKINWMKVQLDVKGKGLEDPAIELPGFSQAFSGEKNASEIKGEFIVKTATPQVNNPPVFPVKGELSADLAPFLKPDVGIESDEDSIRNRALEATWKASNIWEAARKVNTWVGENIPQGVALPSARMTLINEQGNSESKALLAISFCRAVGIPARKAGGVIFSAGNFIPHYWFEVYTGESGWVPLDPSARESEQLGATHVRLFGDGEFTNMKAQVIDFEPKPPTRLTYINREMVWPVGEERTYIVKKRGKIIGEEFARMEEVTVLKDAETYRMSLKSTLRMGEEDTKTEGNLWINPQGLPVLYERNSSRGDVKESETLDFQGALLNQKIKDYRGEFERSIPFSKGAYLADPSLLSQWALISGQLNDAAIGKSYTFSVFVPETLSIETLQADVKKMESVEAADKIYDAFQVETNQGITFWIDQKTKKTVKISFRIQEVDLEMSSAQLKI